MDRVDDWVLDREFDEDPADKLGIEDYSEVALVGGLPLTRQRAASPPRTITITPELSAHYLRLDAATVGVAVDCGVAANRGTGLAVTRCDCCDKQ